MKLPGRAKPRAKFAPDFFSLQVSEARRFYLDLSPANNRSLVVACGGVERSSIDYAIHRTTFPFYAIEYVARGRGTVKLRGRAHALQPGLLFSYGPGIRLDITTDPADPLVKYFVDFSGIQAPQLLRDCKLAPATAARVFPPSEIEGLFDEIVNSGLRGTRHTAELCAKLLECLTLKILEARAPLEGAGTLAFSTYQHCRQHIQQHFLRLRSLEQIADECHIDGAYLCRLFGRYDHQSPYRYLLRLKMNRAAEWLQRPGALVKQVSDQAGFSDPFHFSRAFKSVFGLSPDTFRGLR
jgi:AraC-like DNA-binding protein